MANPLSPLFTGAQNLYGNVTGALRGADLQGALANPMFLYGASILGRGKSRSPQPLFNMQELVQAQQVADSYKKRQFLSDLAERSQDYSAKREALEAGESALDDIMKQDYFYDDKDDPITGQPYGQLLSAEEAFSIGGKTPEELQAVETLTGLSPTYDFASTDPEAMTLENIRNLTQADIQANLLAETGVDPMSRQALMTAMLESGSPDLVASAIAEKMKKPTTTVVGEGDALYAQNPDGSFTLIGTGAPKKTTALRTADFLAMQPAPRGDGTYEYDGQIYANLEDATQARNIKVANVEKVLEMGANKTLMGDAGVLQSIAQMPENTEEQRAIKTRLLENVLAKSDIDALSPFQKSYDQVVGKQLAEYQMGGAPNAIADINRLQEAIAVYEADPEKKLSGRFSDLVFGDKLRALTDPTAANVKEQILTVGQRGLRETLGAAFTANEGEQFLRRLWNDALPTEVNIARAKRMLNTLQQSHQNKMAMIEHMQTNNTLSNYIGPKMDDEAIKDQLNKELDAMDIERLQKNPDAYPQISLEKITNMEEADQDKWMRKNKVPNDGYVRVVDENGQVRAVKYVYHNQLNVPK